MSEFSCRGLCLTYSSSPLTRDSLTYVVILMPWALLSALLHRSWRVHKSTAFVVWAGHELQPLQMSSQIRHCCSSLCMSQSVSSRCGRLRVFAGAHVTFDSSIFMVCRTERAAVHCFLICGIINSGAQSGPFTVHSHREIKRMWKNRFLVQNDQMDWHKMMQFFPVILLLSISF